MEALEEKLSKVGTQTDANTKARTLTAEKKSSKKSFEIFFIFLLVWSHRIIDMRVLGIVRCIT